MSGSLTVVIYSQQDYRWISENNRWVADIRVGYSWVAECGRCRSCSQVWLILQIEKGKKDKQHINKTLNTVYI